jgi:hypothetical protein
MSPELIQAQAVQEEQNLFARGIDYVREHGAISVTALVAAGALGISGCGSTSHKSAESSPSASASATPSASASPSANGNKLSGNLQPETDKSLASGGYNCGVHVPEAANINDYDNQVAYLNSDPEVSKKLIDFQISDPTYGMGESAWKVATAKAYVNENTKSSVKNNTEMNQYSHLMSTYELPKDKYPNGLNFLNFTCKEGKVTAIEYANIKAGSTVNGFVFDKAGIDAYRDAVKKDGNGDSIIKIISIGKIKGTDEEGFMAITEFEGCKNPNRAIPTEIEKELLTKPVPTSSPSSTVLPKPTPTTPPTVPPTTPPTTTPNKVPVPLPGPNTQPGAGGTESSTSPSQDSPVTGYAPGETPPTAAPAPMRAPAPQPTAAGETGNPTPGASHEGTVPTDTNHGTAPVTPQ